jgi:hypothetical protein
MPAGLLIALAVFIGLVVKVLALPILVGLGVVPAPELIMPVNA